MKKVVAVIALGIVSALADIPTFEERENITLKSGDNLTVFNKLFSYELQGFASPEFEDWDNDGLKDLIVGQFIDSKILFFKNSGSKADPQFENPIEIEADGASITRDYG